MPLLVISYLITHDYSPHTVSSLQIEPCYIFSVSFLPSNRSCSVSQIKPGYRTAVSLCAPVKQSLKQCHLDWVTNYFLWKISVNIRQQILPSWSLIHSASSDPKKLNTGQRLWPCGKLRLNALLSIPLIFSKMRFQLLSLLRFISAPVWLACLFI